MKAKIKNIINQIKKYIQNQFGQLYMLRELQQSIIKKDSDISYIDNLIEKTETRMSKNIISKENKEFLTANISKQLEYKEKIKAKQIAITEQMRELKSNSILLKLLIALKIEKDI